MHHSYTNTFSKRERERRRIAHYQSQCKGLACEIEPWNLRETFLYHQNNESVIKRLGWNSNVTVCYDNLTVVCIC